MASAKQPHLLIGEGDINETVLLPGDPGRVDRIADQCTEVNTVATNREYRVVNATYEGAPLTICSTGIGSPSAAIAAEELAAVGARRLLRVGTTGALQADIDIGDLVVATAAAKDEGTTKRYESATIPAVADHRIQQALTTVIADADVPVHIGPIVTDDAFYAETPEYVSKWESAGLLAVEMEAAALFTIARREGLQAGAICTVDGNLVAGTQKGETEDEELPPAARNRVDRMIATALEAVSELAG